MAGEYAVTGLAVPESLDRLQDLMDVVRADHPDIDETDLSMFETAIVEIHGNVVEHGRPPGQVVYAFRLEVHPDRLVGALTDTGNAAPDLSGLEGLPDDLAESGRGLWLAKATLDELDYSRTGEGNTWRLVRQRHRAGERPMVPQPE
jgi:serine/threonine-protein kinase RsbW